MFWNKKKKKYIKYLEQMDGHVKKNIQETCKVNKLTQGENK